MIEWTPQQEAIFERITADDVGDTVVIARAGSGKTTTIEEAIKRIPRDQSILYLAFNRNIADAARKRLRSPNVRVATCHSFGLSMLQNAYGYIEVVPNRSIALAKQRLNIHDGRRFSLAKLSSLLKDTLTSDVDKALQVFDEYGVTVEGDPTSVAQQALRLKSEAETWSAGPTVDFDDMVYLPLALDVPIMQYDRVFVDEAQDLNAAQIALLYKTVKPSSGRICAIGDDRQAIYGFRGADRRAIHRLTHETNATTLPLSTSFRCAKAIVTEARKIVPDITALPSAPDGSVTSADLDSCIAGAEYGEFIISRLNAPLISIAMKLAADNCRVTILGRDVGEGLVDVIYRMRASNVSELRAKATAWAARESARFMQAEPPNVRSAKLVDDRLQCILTLCQKRTTIDDIVDKVRELFADPKDRNLNSCVVLSTAHQAKGLEADKVWLLRDTFLLRNRNTGKPDLEEYNLLYVGITRAKNSLIYVVNDRSSV